MRIAFGTDESTPLTDEVVAELERHGHQVTDVAKAEPWPEVGHLVGEAVASGRADRGVVCCWTGTGVSMAANKVPGVRAALCTDAETARGARRWNDANVLAIGLMNTPAGDVSGIVDAWLDTADVDPDEVANIERVSALERRYAARSMSGA